MLIHCPRCGFQQPKDKYCAQCGVDMEVYRRPQASLLSRVLGNPAVQIGAVLLLAGFVGLSLYQRKRKDLEDRVSYLKNDVQIARSVSSPGSGQESAGDAPPPAQLAASPTDTAALADAAKAAPPAVAGTAAVASTTVPQGDAKALAATATTPAAKSAIPKGSVLVRIFFAEVAQPYLEEIWDESRATGQFNTLADHTAGIIPDLGKKVSPSNRNVKILMREERAIEVGKPVQFFQGVRQGDPENEIGLSYYIELQENDAGVYRGSVDLARSWRETSAGVTTTQKRLYPAVFELSPGSGFFMSGLLTPSNELANLEDLVAISPFQILRSPSFRSGQTYSVLFLEFDKTQ